MITPGLCSVTLRSATVDEIAELALDCRLGAIEWGADVHVQPGDDAAVRRARAAGGGLICTYGSYLMAGTPRDAGSDVLVLDTALALGASTVRVWCSFGIEPGSEHTGAIVDDLRTIAALAAERDMRVGVEFHGGTLTATVASTIALLDAVAAPNLGSYWQPPYWLAARPPARDADDVRSLGERLVNLHVYEWTHAPDVQRRVLECGRERWAEVFAAVPSGPHLALLEFVAGESAEQVARDAQTLVRLIGEAGR